MDTMKLTVAFHNYVNEPTNELLDQPDHKPVKLQQHTAWAKKVKNNKNQRAKSHKSHYICPGQKHYYDHL
jgi:hypothetical protein